MAGVESSDRPEKEGRKGRKEMKVETKEERRRSKDGTGREGRKYKNEGREEGRKEKVERWDRREKEGKKGMEEGLQGWGWIKKELMVSQRMKDAIRRERKEENEDRQVG
ncbi:hypothetical protein Pcinc_042536 [Petrolisthes cinctipes]|uniref:Uncharacterized protein n=1 Tax=Petrolisthes cinctipes TaxID=88211 RepID=A0AAE1BHA7_PETCI|nr:hypothetical protein Pcinc_042536 [Petrolisthes cinctipes]